MKKQRSNHENKQGTKNLGEYSREVVLNNKDLVTEILLRIPAKSLIRFKCVSKLWLSLISDPIFSSNHARRNSSSLVSGFYFYYKTFGHKSNFRLRSISVLDKNQSLPNFNFLVPNYKVSNLIMVDACNGLVLFSEEEKYTVCNPTTGKHRNILPYNLDVEIPNRNGMAWLAFDPSKSNRYKIIRIEHTDNRKVDEIDIYSSENSSWKRVSIIIERIDELKKSNQVYWNKALNWVTKDHFHTRLDVENEKLTLTPLGKITENHDIKHFGTCHGNLIMIIIKSNYPSTYFRVLEMKSNNNCWVFKYKINIYRNHFREVVGLYSHVVNVANGIDGNEALIHTKVIRDPNQSGSAFLHSLVKIVYFGTYSNIIQELDHLPFGGIFSTIFHFFETLSPV